MLTDGTALDRVIVSYSRVRTARLNESVPFALHPQPYPQSCRTSPCQPPKPNLQTRIPDTQARISRPES